MVLNVCLLLLVFFGAPRPNPLCAPSSPLLAGGVASVHRPACAGACKRRRAIRKPSLWPRGKQRRQRGSRGGRVGAVRLGEADRLRMLPPRPALSPGSRLCKREPELVRLAQPSVSRRGGGRLWLHLHLGRRRRLGRRVGLGRAIEERAQKGAAGGVRLQRGERLLQRGVELRRPVRLPALRQAGQQRGEARRVLRRLRRLEDLEVVRPPTACDRLAASRTRGGACGAARVSRAWREARQR